MEENKECQKEECQELKNIKYKTMLLNGVSLHETKSSNDLLHLDNFLENEKINNVNDPWCKLNKTIKTQKIMDFIDKYKLEKSLNNEETQLLVNFLKECLDKKKLQRIKDVIYDKNTGIIKDIPALTYVKSNKHFTLKNIDKRVSTLKSLAPKKCNHSTIKNKLHDVNANTDLNESDEENDN